MYMKDLNLPYEMKVVQQFPAIGMHLAQTACTRYLKKHVLLQFRVVDALCA